MSVKIPVVDVSSERIDSLLDRVNKRQLSEEDYSLLSLIIGAYRFILTKLQEKQMTIKRLLRIFGIKTERKKNLIDSSETEKPPKQKSKGHGRNAAADYPNATRIPVPHTMTACMQCPLCERGRLYDTSRPCAVVRIVAQPLFNVNIYELQRLRCNLCGATFTAPPPEDAKKPKYDETVGSLLAVLRYGSGFPNYRLASLLKHFGVPFPASTQYELLADLAEKLTVLWKALVHIAAQGSIFYNDDTTMRVLSLAKQQTTSGRTGIFTTGIVVQYDEHLIALFFTGRKHAGENLTDLLIHRAAGLPDPLQECDASSRNIPDGFQTILCNCLTHARRKYVEIYDVFPEQARFVIESLAKVYHFDDLTKKQLLSDDDRLHFHQMHSKPIMDSLFEWFKKQFDDKLVEPNSSMGKAISYFLKHWIPLTQFLRVPGAPLDNNICERALKCCIRQRKNSLFYKTEHGAFVGDMLMSLFHTCTLNDANPYHYFTALQQNIEHVNLHPQLWFPWNYLATLASLNSS